MALQARPGEPRLGKVGKLGNDDEPADNKDGGQRRSKQGPRKRVSQACDRCRSRKDKCDGKKPACSTCTTNGRICSYDTNVKKRGLPEGYVRGMEKLWGLAIKDVDSMEDNVLSALAVDENTKETPLGIWNDESNSEIWVDIWRKSQISRELERLLSSQEPTEKRKRLDSDVQSSRRPDIETRGPVPPSSTSKVTREDCPEGNKAGWTESRFGIRQPDLRNSPQMAAYQGNGNGSDSARNHEAISSPLPRVGSSSGTPAESIELPELPSETWHLLDVYFSYTHSWLPIIEKHDLLRASYQYSQQRTAGLPQSRAGSGEHAVLWASIAYAKFQHRAINSIPRALGPVADTVWTAEKMYTQARSLIPNEEGDLELGHVQALIILTLANMGMGHHSRAWALIGQAVRIAIDLQLDRPSDKKSRAKHVFLGCFSLDTIIAAQLGRRPHLRTGDISIVGPIEEDGLEEWDPWTDCLAVKRAQSGGSRVPASILSTFNRLVQVLKVLNEAACLPVGPRRAYLSTSISEKLQNWGRSQAPSFHTDPGSMSDGQILSLLPHQYHLHNVYLTTLATSQLFSSQGEESNLEHCAQSGRTLVELVQQHSNTYGLLIVPPTYEYFIKTAYNIVHTVHGSIENTHIILNDWKRSLDNCMDSMEPAWPVFESYKASISYHSTPQAARRESQVAFDLISGMNQDADTPMSGKTPQSIASCEAMGPYSPHSFRPQAVAEMPRQDRSVQQVAKPSSHRSSSFGQSSNHGLPQNPLHIYEDAHGTYGRNNRIPATAAPIKSTVQQTSQTSILLTQPANPRLHRSMTMSSSGDAEFDPMFNELMRLDATEWTGNWDQSLMNLGFEGGDNMNQDFYTFCQEPDPLQQNNVFQQLVASSNAETTDFFHGAGSQFNGMGVGTFRAIGNGLDAVNGVRGVIGAIGGEEHEGIEAGQILQALSKGDEGRARKNG